MKIAITGETGFLGYHLTQHFQYRTNYDIVPLTRDYLNNIDKLKQCDWLIHCAGVNRGHEIRKDNLEIANNLVQLLTGNNIKINLIFISSIQEDLDNEYGNVKRECDTILRDYCLTTNTKYIKYKLPNLFGPFGNPNYNSVVATFCYNLANGIECKINDSNVNLCYVYDVIQAIASFKECNRFETTNISIANLHEQLSEYQEKYSIGTIPELKTKFDIDLFNTYRSYANNVHQLQRHTDDRGYLTELLKCNGSKSQVFFSTTKPGICRGNHFHFGKIERFCVISGKANICIRKLGSEEIFSYIIDDSMNIVIDIPTLHTHNITNIGESDLLCVFWVNEIFNETSSDTYFIKV